MREGQLLKSAAASERLATGAVIEELELVGERLHYKVVSGTGPDEGWVSLKVGGKEIVIPKAEEIGEPGEPGPVDVDEVLKKQILGQAGELPQGSLSLYCPTYDTLEGLAAEPKLRIICFHNAGSSGSIFMYPRSPFTDWILESQVVEVLAVDFPGRGKLLQAEKHASMDSLCPMLLAVLYDKLADDVPYVVWGHGLGVWVCFEVLLLARRCGLSMPRAALLNAFPAPHLPCSKRPWRRIRGLNSSEVQDLLKSWDAAHFCGPGRVIFDEPEWKQSFEPIIRADFQMQDEYRFKHAGAPPFEFPIHSFHMEGDSLIKAEMVQMWKAWTTSELTYKVMRDMGHLTCLYNLKHRAEYLGAATDEFKKYVGL